MKIVTLTLNPALDKSTTTDRLVPEQKLRCTSLLVDAGGGGINVSKGIRKLGGQSTAIFPSGGQNGLTLQRLLALEHIETRVVEVGGESRENLSVTEQHTNQQFRFTMPGLEISEKVADACLAIIKEIGPDVLVASGSLPPGLSASYFEKVAAFSKQIQAKFVLDTSGEALKAAADEGVFLLKPNLAELSNLVGASDLEIQEVDDAARQVIEQGMCEIVVVSMGAQGALLVTRQEVKHIPAPPVQKKTTVGAGDSMVAGMVWALSQGKSVREMVQTGVACGSAATLNQGTKLFEPADVQKLLHWIQQYGDRFKIKDF